MKLALFLGAIALFPLPAIANPLEPLNAPQCYMITSTGRLVDLTRLCDGSNAVTQPVSYEVTEDDVCRAFAADFFNAQNQFQRDRAEEGLRYCRMTDTEIERDIRNRLK